MKLKELQEKLNSKIEHFIGKRVRVGDLHEDIRKHVEDSIKEFFTSCRYYPWEVGFDIDIKLPREYSKLLKLNIELKEDKRYKYDRIGTIEKLQFSVVNTSHSELTAEEIVEISLKKHMVDRIKGYDSRIESLNLEIAKLQEEKLKLEKSYNMMIEGDNKDAQL